VFLERRFPTFLLRQWLLCRGDGPSPLPFRRVGELVQSSFLTTSSYTPNNATQIAMLFPKALSGALCRALQTKVNYDPSASSITPSSAVTCYRPSLTLCHSFSVSVSLSLSLTHTHTITLDNSNTPVKFHKTLLPSPSAILSIYTV